MTDMEKIYSYEEDDDQDNYDPEDDYEDDSEYDY